MNFQLNEPFRQFAYLKELLLEYPGKATDFQKALHQSQLSKAAKVSFSEMIPDLIKNVFRIC